ncbi:hypothetical protein CES93_23815 [Citrobacter freundii]|nr:hypothetical protein CES93_23815 [Citrobacter freundii]
MAVCSKHYWTDGGEHGQQTPGSPLTHLPEVGIKGNTHFPFSDLNNVQIADLVSKFLKEKDLQ